MNKLNKFISPTSVLTTSIILGLFIYLGIIEKQQSVNTQQKKDDCIKSSIERLEKVQSKNNDKSLIINATWNFSKKDDICYYIESQIWITPSGTVITKYIYNLNTNQQLYASITNGDGGDIGGISKTEIDKIEVDILKK